MPNLTYSTEALNVKSQFLHVDVVIYVEGDDDFCFWKYKFSLINTKMKYRLEAVGGYAINDYISKIINENTKIIVACDTDHKIYSYLDTHPRIVRTYGYSIENTMYCPNVLNDTINKLSKTDVNNIENIKAWLESSCLEVKTILLYAVANFIFSKGIPVFGDKCSKLLKNDTSHEFDKNKIDAFIKKLNPNFTSKELMKAEKVINADKRNLIYKIKGHFLTNLVLNYITKQINYLKKQKMVKRKKTSKEIVKHETLYAVTIQGCLACNNKKCCNDKKSIDKRIKKAIASLKGV